MTSTPPEQLTVGLVLGEKALDGKAEPREREISWQLVGVVFFFFFSVLLKESRGGNEQWWCKLDDDFFVTLRFR